ncbi:hypothetical protein [Streptomyces sp. NPDC093795]|uniref:hypothetical protein n=1 Tax=Streptomyces sp. NPDC093795 TaxID=3366051 RepID=UPI00381743E8
MRMTSLGVENPAGPLLLQFHDHQAQCPVLAPDAVRFLAAQWTGTVPLTVLSPESRGGVRADRYEQQDQQRGVRP